MAIVVKDRVKVSTTTTGTGTITLGSAESGFQAFSVIGDGNQTYYTITSGLSDYEVGIGTYTHSGTTLSRDTILESSNSGSAVSLTGTSTVFTTYPAERASFSDQGLSKTFTASGTITAGKPCILETDGDAAQITQTSTGNTVAEGFGTITNFAGNQINYVSPTLAVIGTDKVAVAYRDNSNSNYATVQIGEVNGTTNAITWGSKTVVDSNAIALSGIAYDTNTSTLAVLYGTTSWAEVKGATVSGTTPTFGSSKSLSTTSSLHGYAMQYDPDNQTVTVFLAGAQSGNTRLRIYDITVNGTATPVENYYSENDSLDSWWLGSAWLRTVYDTNTNVWLVTNEETNSSTQRFFVVTNSGSAITATERTKSLTDFGGYMDLCFDSTNNKVVCIYKGTNNPVHQTHLVNFTMSADNFTAGTATVSTVDNDGAIQWCAYDPSSERVVVFAGRGSVVGAKYGVFSNNGTAFTEISTATFGPTDQNYYAQRGGVTKTAMTSLTSNPIVLAMHVNVSATSFAGAFSVEQTPVVTTNFDNNYLGVAATSANNTEEVKINLPEGSINNSQSGLEIGEDYFCNTAGNIAKFRTSSTSGVVTEAYSAETALNDPSEKVTVVSDGNNTFLQVYQGSSMYSTIQAGTMSGTTMTWGTAQVIESTDGSGQAIWWDSYRSCFVVVVRSTTGNSYIEASTITVSGQTITVNNSATTQVFSGSQDQSSMTGGYDSTAQVGFVHNTTGSGGEKSSVIVVSVDSSKNVSFGTEVTNTTKVTYPSQFVHDSNGNANIAVIAATYDGTTEVTSTQAYVITISGTTPTIQTPVVLNTTAYEHGYAIYDASAQKTVCVYEDGSNIAYNVCSVSSGTLTAGTHTTITAGEIDSDLQEWAICGCYDPFTEQIGIVYSDSSNYMYLRSGKVSGTSITWSDAQAVDPSTVNKHVNLVNANSTDSNVLVLYWVNYDSAFNTWTMGSAGTTTYTQTDAQYIGEAISTTALKLKETPTDIIFGKASTTIAKGNPVLVEADGDFAKIESSTSSVSVSYSDGTPSEIHEGWVDMSSVSYDEAQGKFLVAYRDQDNGSYGFCRLVTVSNKTLTVGSETSAYNSNSTTPLDSMYIGDSKHCIVYYDNSSHGKAIIATVSGDSVTFGSAVTWSTTTIHSRASAYYDSNAGAVVISGRRGGSSVYYTVALSVSGTTLTAGTVVEDSSYTNTDYYCSAYDVNAQIGVVGFRNTSDDGYLRTISVSGNTVTLNTAMNFNSTSNVTMLKDSLTYDPVSQKCFIIYRDIPDSEIRGRVVSISGTTVTVGTDAQVLGFNSSNFGCQGTDQGGIVCVCRNQASPYYLQSRIATISGTSFSMTNSETLTSASVENPPSLAYQPSDYTVLIIYGDQSSHDLQGVCVIPEGTVSLTTYNLTTENFIGLADIASTANGTSKVRINGVDANNTGLTAGQLYYVKNDGTLSTTAESGKVVEAGKALSATKLLVKG